MPNRTKRDILYAFNTLLEKKDFEKITVDEICHVAEVSRTTFYRYFRDKYDVMTYNFQKLFDQYLSTAYADSMQEFLTNMYRATQENLHQLRRAFEVLGRNSMNDVIYSYCVNALIEWISKQSGGELSKKQRIQCDILAYGISYIGDNWINGRYELTPEEAAEATIELMTPEMKNSLDTE